MFPTNPETPAQLHRWPGVGMLDSTSWGEPERPGDLYPIWILFLLLKTIAFGLAWGSSEDKKLLTLWPIICICGALPIDSHGPAPPRCGTV